MRRLFVAVIAVLAACAGTAQAAPAIPNFWDAKERPPKPDVESLGRIRFLTTLDFPPFSFIDQTARLSGFNIDLARAICERLEIGNRCQIQALPWDELDDALERGDGEAIVAGIAVTESARERYAFSRPYIQFPARFVMRNTTAVGEPLHEHLAGKRVGVLEDTAHEQMLRDLFGDVLQVVTFSRSKWLLDGLESGNVDAAFGDGMRLGFWLAGPASEDCCTFAGGPYLAPEYLGHGLALAVPKDDAALAEAFDYALHQIAADGTFSELYLRYFPVSFY